MNSPFAARAADRSGPWPWLALAIVVVLVAAAFKLRFVQDDAFISFRYADNLVRGAGLVFNPGEPVEGYTNFLWTLLVAAGMRLGLDPVPTAHVLGLACFAGSLSLVFLLASHLLASRRQALVALLLTGTNYTFLCYGTGGLETQLQALLFLGLVRLSVGALRAPPTPVLLVGVSLVAALALLTRLDSAVVVAACGAAVLWRIGRDRTGAGRLGAAVALLAPAAVLVGGWLAWKWSTYGGLLPNTFHVKVGGGTSVVRGVGYLFAFLASYFLVAHAVLAIALGRDLRRLASAPHRLVAATIVLWCAYVVWVGGDFMEFRFFVPILPLATILLVWMVMNAIDQRAVRLALLALVPAGTVHHWKYYETRQAIGSIWELRKYMESPAEDWPGVGRALHALFGKNHDDVTIAVMPCGAIPYYSRLRTIDMLGLNDPWVARHGMPLGTVPGHSRLAPLRYLLERNVHLVVAHPRVEPVTSPRTSFSLGEVARFLVQPVAPGDLPTGARFVELPVNASHRVTMLYLREHPAVEREIEAGSIRVLPIVP
jgi:arabinofuranosyltransferase